MENSGRAIGFLVLFPVNLRWQTPVCGDRNGADGMSPRQSQTPACGMRRANRGKRAEMQGFAANDPDDGAPTEKPRQLATFAMSVRGGGRFDRVAYGVDHRGPIIS